MSDATNASDARVQAVFAEEVKRIHDNVTQLAAETVAEGRKAGYTAEQALGVFHSKVKKFLGPWT